MWILTYVQYCQINSQHTVIITKHLISEQNTKYSMPCFVPWTEYTLVLILLCVHLKASLKVLFFDTLFTLWYCLSTEKDIMCHKWPCLHDCGGM